MIVPRALWVVHVAAVLVLAVHSGHEHPIIYDGIGGIAGFAVFILTPVGTVLVAYTCGWASASVPLAEKVIIGALQVLLIPAWLATGLTGVSVSIWLIEHVVPS